MKADGQAISRQDLKDTAIVALILLVQSAVPFVLRTIRGPEKFFDKVVFYLFNACVIISWPFLALGSGLLLRASRAHAKSSDGTLSTTSAAESQLRSAAYGAGVTSFGCIIQSTGGMIWLAEARLHPKSQPLIAFAIFSSAMIAVIGIHLAQFVLSLREPLLMPGSFDMPAEPKSSPRQVRSRGF